MTYDIFEKLVSNITEQDVVLSSLLYNFGIDLEILNIHSNEIVSLFLRNEYGENGEDIFWWWMYDESEKMIDIDDIKYDVTSLEDIWEFLEQFYNLTDGEFNKDKEDIKNELH